MPARVGARYDQGMTYRMVLPPFTPKPADHYLATRARAYTPGELLRRQTSRAIRLRCWPPYQHIYALLKGATFAAWGRRLGIHGHHFAYILQGKRNPTFRLGVDIADALGITPRDFITFLDHARELRRLHGSPLSHVDDTSGRPASARGHKSGGRRPGPGRRGRGGADPQALTLPPPMTPDELAGALVRAR